MRLQAEVAEWFGSGVALPPAGRVHFVGIGGAGMSALARILLKGGRQVSGSDSAETAATGRLRELGASVWIGHSAEHAAGAAAVVVSDAVDLATNPEAFIARGSGIPLLRRSQLLGQLIANKRVIAVTGSHGKSTVTAILAQILQAAGYDPLAIVGADVPGFDGNVRHGNGDWAVVEACEAYDSFHDIKPDHVLLTNLEPEHLDYHKTWQGLLDSVVRFVRSARTEPRLIYCSDDEGACKVSELVGDGIPYSSKNALSEAELLGAHNRLNAGGAVEIARLIGIPDSIAIEAARSAKGCARRLEWIGEVEGIVVYDDYAHHPTEIRASLAALREAFPKQRLVVAFQPHLYSRTRDQLDEFAPSFKDADVVFITDIYPAREEPIPGISSALIIQRLEALGTECYYVPMRHWLPLEVGEHALAGDVVVGMGAGNIDVFAPAFIDEMRRKAGPLKVAVLAGGASAEREVSILSGDQITRALRSIGYEVVELDPEAMLAGRGDASQLTGPNRPEIAFLALHGTGAEDGAIQGLLQLLRIPFTGSDLMSSALAMDKDQTKRLLNEAGLPTAKGTRVRKGDQYPRYLRPCVVKPNAQGSTIGLSFVDSPNQFERALNTALKYDDSALVEEWVRGVEISVPVLGSEALPVVEIVPRNGTYDFASKYTPGETEEIVPARIGESESRVAQEYALRAHQILGAVDVSRTDMIVNEQGIVILEVNTLPGMTSTSLLPRSAQAAGIEYPELCRRILQFALARYGIKKS